MIVDYGACDLAFVYHHAADFFQQDTCQVRRAGSSRLWSPAYPTGLWDVPVFERYSVFGGEGQADGGPRCCCEIREQVPA